MEATRRYIRVRYYSLFPAAMNRNVRSLGLDVAQLIRIHADAAQASIQHRASAVPSSNSNRLQVVEIAANASGLNGSFPPKRPPQANSQAESLLNAQQVADRLGVSERWVRDHATRRQPRLRAVKLGSLLRFRWSDVDEFLNAQLTEHPTQTPSRGI
jgi:excisionase family DNA binding protein